MTWHARDQWIACALEMQQWARTSLTIILRNRVEYRLILTASSAKIRRYSARLSRIIVILFNKLITKLVTFLNLSVDIFSLHFFFSCTKLHIPPDICYLRMTVEISRASWPYLDSVTICWIIMAHSRSFLANQRARNAIVGAENLLINN